MVGKKLYSKTIFRNRKLLIFFILQVTSRNSKTRTASLVRLDELLADSATRKLVAKKIDVLFDTCQKRLQNLFDEKIVQDKARPKDYRDVVTYVLSVLTELLTYPDVVRHATSAALEKLIDINTRILLEPKVLQYPDAYMVIGGLKGLISQIFDETDLTAVVIALLQLLLRTDSSVYRNQIFQYLRDLAKVLPGLVLDQHRSFDVDLVIAEIKNFIATQPINAVKPLLVAIVKIRGPAVLDFLTEVEKSKVLGSVPAKV